jgi:hypothetical protein
MLNGIPDREDDDALTVENFLEANIAVVQVGCTEIRARCNFLALCTDVHRLGVCLKRHMVKMDGATLALDQLLFRDVGVTQRDDAETNKKGTD